MGARMDGTPLERALWRVNALREALVDVQTTRDVDAIHSIAENALGVDAENSKSTGIYPVTR